MRQRAGLVRWAIGALFLALVPAISVISVASAAWAAEPALPPVPERWATDTVGFLTPVAREALDSRLRDYEKTSGHQVLVWIGHSTGVTPIEDYTVRTFQAWKVGRKGIDDGLVIFIFADDRKVRFEVGYGLEGTVPDAIASRIINEQMTPKLAAGDRDGAVAAGVAATLEVISGGGLPKGAATEALRTPETPAPLAPEASQPLSPFQKIFFALLAIGFLILLITHPSLALYLLINILSGGRGGGGGGGGGGGFSGGGGRSGGGGATGSW